MQLPTHTAWAHKAMFFSEHKTNSATCSSECTLWSQQFLDSMRSSSSSQLSHMCFFSSPFDGCLAFRFWQIRKEIKPSQNLSFITVCSGWNVQFSHIHGFRVNYDPNWKTSWIHPSLISTLQISSLLHTILNAVFCLLASLSYRRPAYSSGGYRNTT